MIREAELFVLADQAALRVFRQIRAEQWDAMLPPVFDMPGADQPTPLRQAVNHWAYDDSWVPDLMAGPWMRSAATASTATCSATCSATRSPA
jgi:hypothetical protein